MNDISPDMVFVPLELHGIRLEALAPHHAQGLRAAATDGALWNLRVTSVPEPEQVPPVAVALAPGLLELLRCPLTGGTLIHVDADRLMSDRPFRDGVHPVYPIAHGIACLTPGY